MTDIERQLREHDGRLKRRDCRICKEPIMLMIQKNGVPAIESCICRQSGKRLVIPSSWSDLASLAPPGA